MEPTQPAIVALRAAVLMEETGRVFYDSLAAATQNPSAALLFRRLSTQEGHHQRTFQRMLEIEMGGTSDWDEADAERARDWVKASILPDPDAIKAATVRGSARDAVELAVKMELQAVSFYRLLLCSAPARDQDTIREIIRHEESHAEDLMKILAGAATGAAEDPRGAEHRCGESQ